jgi:hypothetical protein
MDMTSKTEFTEYSKIKEYETQQTLYFTELIDTDKLKFLYYCFDECYENFGKFKHPTSRQYITDKRTIQTLIEKRLKTKNNEIKYSSKSKVGRLSSSTWCYQNMNKTCRHFLLLNENDEFYCYDIDMISAHPNMLYQILLIIGFKETKYLEDYINNRETCLKEYMEHHKCDRDTAKDAFLSLINDDSKLVRVDDIIYDFYQEMKAIQNKIWEFCMKEHPEIISKSKDKVKGNNNYNLKGVCMANFLQTIENKCLQTMIDFVQSKGFNFVAPCHDGGLLPKNKVDNYGLEKLIEDLENHMFETLNLKIKLASKPMECGFELNEIYKKKKLEESLKEQESLSQLGGIEFEKVSVGEDYSYRDFWEGRRDCFKSKTDAINYVREYLPKVLILIHYNKGFFLKNEGSNEHTLELYNAVSLQPFIDERISYITINSKGKPEVVEVKLKKMIEYSKVKTYDNVVCIPNWTGNNDRQFNVWIPFIADKKIKYDMNRVQPILDYMHNIVCNEDMNVYKWFFSWIRHICKYPEKKTGVVPLLYSKKQRAGKGTFVNWTINSVFGRHCSYITNINKVCKNFNSFLQGKILVYIDELPTTNGEYHNIFDTFKNLITDPLLDIEKKGVESYTTDNLLNFIASTNNKYSVKIEKDDGRWCVIPVNESKIGDTAFWDDCYKNIFTIENGVHFFNYMINIEDDDSMIVNIKEIPQTDIRKDIQEMCLSATDLFYMKLKNREIDMEISIIGNNKKDDFNNIVNPLICELDINGEYYVKTGELFRVFKQWCEENNYKRISKKFFTDVFKENHGRINTIHGDNKTYRYYTI